MLSIMNAKKHTRIYDLIKHIKVFIGRCTAIKLSAAVYAHCWGEHIQAEKYFGQDQNWPKLKMNPTLYTAIFWLGFTPSKSPVTMS